MAVRVARQHHPPLTNARTSYLDTGALACASCSDGLTSTREPGASSRIAASAAKGNRRPWRSGATLITHHSALSTQHRNACLLAVFRKLFDLLRESHENLRLRLREVRPR